MLIDRFANAAFILSASLILVFLTGCASVRYKEFPLDSRLPITSHIPVCTAPNANELASLNINARCFAQVRSEAHLSRVPIAIRKNESYRLKLSNNQAWFDMSNRVNSSEGFHGSRFMNFFRRLKRDEDLDWMALSIALVTSECGDAPLLQSKALKTDGTTFEAKHDGQLAFFPNDAEGWEGFYRNNVGMVWVEVTRTADIAPVVMAPTAKCNNF